MWGSQGGSDDDSLIIICVDGVCTNMSYKVQQLVALCRTITNLLDQIQSCVNTYRTHPEKVSALFDSILAEYSHGYEVALTPFVSENINMLSQNVLCHFQRHCDIAALEQQLYKQMQVLPEKEQKTFKKTVQTMIYNLRQDTNAPQNKELGKTRQETLKATPKTAAGGGQPAPFHYRLAPPHSVRTPQLKQPLKVRNPKQR